MSKFPRMCIGLGMLAAVVAAPAVAGSPTGADSAQPTVDSDSGLESTERVKRVGTRLETIVVTGGAVDPQNRRWDDSGAAIEVLPRVSESAFLDGAGADLVESPTDSRP